MSDQPLLLRACKINRRAPTSDRWLLHDVSVDVSRGDRIAILGPSGSGKSLLLRSLALLDPVESGILEREGKPAAEPGIPEHRRQVIYLHQRPALFEGTVESNLQAPFSLKLNRDRRYDRPRILELLESVGRDQSFLGKNINELSGGEAQMLALVRAIQLDPVVLLLDEPTAALDEHATSAAESLILGWLKGEDRRAILLVSHDASQAARLAKRAIYMRDGSIEKVENL